MKATLPDVCRRDSVTDACARMGIQKVGLLFQKAAEACRHGHGFTNNAEVGEKWYNLWARDGWFGLRDTPACQTFILECCEGQHTNEFAGNPSKRL